MRSRKWAPSLRRLVAFAITATVTYAASATPGELITNGGFEAGMLTGWYASSSNADLGGGFDVGWNVASSAALGGGISVANPVGSYAAYESFDGSGPKTRTLTQGFVVPESVSQAALSFSDSWYATTFHGGTLPRLFDAYLIDGSDTFDLYHLSALNASPLPFALQSFDVTNFLQGREGDTVRLSFVTTIPEYGTGPGGFGLDNVSLLVNVPEPPTFTLFGVALIALAITLRSKRPVGSERA